MLVPFFPIDATWYSLHLSPFFKVVPIRVWRDLLPYHKHGRQYLPNNTKIRRAKWLEWVIVHHLLCLKINPLWNSTGKLLWYIICSINYVNHRDITMIVQWTFLSLKSSSSTSASEFGLWWSIKHIEQPCVCVCVCKTIRLVKLLWSVVQIG